MISNKKINDIIKIVHTLKGVTKAIKNETKEQKRRNFKHAVGYFRS